MNLRNPEMKRPDLPLLFLIAAILLSLLFFRPWISADGHWYYSQLLSIVEDRDLNAYHQVLPWYLMESGSPYLWRSQGGYVTMPQFIGAPLMWAPVYWTASHIVAILGKASLYSAPPGINALCVSSVCFTSLALGLAGLLFTVQALARLAGRDSALITAALLWAATPLLAFTSVEPSFAHSASFLCGSLLLFLWLQYRQNPSVSMAIGLGMAAGLAALVRLQDGLCLVIPAGETAMELLKPRRHTRSRAVMYLICMALPAMAMASPQLALWQVVQGSILGHSKWRFAAFPGQFAPQVLFSLRKGLFTWTPAVLLFVPGTLTLWRRDKSASAWILTGFLLQVILNGSLAEWWQGGSFGPRRFIGILPFLAVPMATAIQNALRKHRLTIFFGAFALSAWNLILMAGFYCLHLGYEDPLRLAPFTSPRLVAASLLCLRAGTFAYGDGTGWERFPLVSPSTAIGLLCAALVTGIAIAIVVILLKSTRHRRCLRYLSLSLPVLLALSLSLTFLHWGRQSTLCQEALMLGRMEDAIPGQGWAATERTVHGQEFVSLNTLPLSLRVPSSYKGSMGIIIELSHLPADGQIGVSLDKSCRAEEILVVVRAESMKGGEALDMTFPFLGRGRCLWHGPTWVCEGPFSAVVRRDTSVFSFDGSKDLQFDRLILDWSGFPSDWSVGGILLVPAKGPKEVRKEGVMDDDGL